MSDRPMLDLLLAGGWEEHQPMFDRLAAWPLYHLLLRSLETLKHEALYVSQMHGLGHIERTMLQGAFCAMEEGLNEADTSLLLDACSYHDVGRINDWEDQEHGHRSAQAIGALTGRTGEDLKILQGAVDAHSRHEPELRPTVEGYSPRDLDQAIRIAQLLKDADGLDRVRLGDLNPAYLRRDASRARVALAQAVFDRYQAYLGMASGPLLSQEIIDKLRKIGKQPRD